MENPTVPARASADLLSDCRVPRDFELLTQYSAYLIAENIESDRQASMLASARQFLRWWRTQFVGDDYEIRDAAGSRPMHESAWHHLREAYLRHACPHCGLGEEQRAWMNRFLRFIAGCGHGARPAKVRREEEQGFAPPVHWGVDHACSA
jgi:hypothetical protein